ncbi:UTP-glucose-1-phosphate uridylyltransferase [Kalmusia sp. IMI 367209]|nr:UTP-glucose-1-phosphate uridylyltransferase [Kalmusia sp. IMI 367209]
MASRAIPSHLKPAAAAGNGGADGAPRHHGKTASHFLPGTCATVAVPSIAHWGNGGITGPFSPMLVDRNALAFVFDCKKR